MGPGSLRRGVVVCGFVALAAGCSERPKVREWRPEDHGQPPRGQIDPARVPAEGAGTPQKAAAALWLVSCAPCHGRGGAGDGPQRPPNAVVKDLRSPDWQSSVNDREMASVIRNGRNLMPRFGNQISDQAIDALVQHVRTLNSAPPPSSPDPKTAQ